ncbi:MAG: aspartyl protease family protein [Sarcina ventriculi]|uniref:aspartyl protease family protein n=1 Tax=Sarcina ventriculi TaxID=1267 RepID=UPI0018AA55D0|nr:aspartyl protease family protein [Sarcina ventriculi]
MNIEFRDGLLFTSIQITYNGVSKVIDNMVIDTGCARTLIVSEVVEEINIRVEPDDELIVCQGIGGTEVSFVKHIDLIKLENIEFKNKDIDFSNIDYEGINGLIGLDLLIEAGIIIDLDKLKMHPRNENR